MMRSAGLLLLAAGLAGAAAVARAQAGGDRLDLQVSTEVSTGSESEPSGVPVRESTLRLRYRGDGWLAQADVPWRRVAGLAAAAPALAPASRSADEGFGDASLKLVLPLRAGAAGSTGLDLVLRLQAASRTAVGTLDTGDAGQSLGLALRRGYGDWNVFGHLGWRRGGTLPGFDPGRTAWHGELGVARRIDSRIEAGAFADVRQGVGGDPALPEATLYAAALDGGDRRWQLFVRRAFAPASPDVGVGLSYRRSF